MRTLTALSALIALSFGSMAFAQSKGSNVECDQKPSIHAANVSPSQTVRLADSLLSSSTKKTYRQQSGGNSGATR